MKLAYPAFVPYPTEADVVAKALVLYNFVKDETRPAEPALTEKEITTVKKITDIPVMPVDIYAVTTTPWETYLNPVVQVVQETTSNIAVDSGNVVIEAPETIVAPEPEELVVLPEEPTAPMITIPPEPVPSKPLLAPAATTTAPSFKFPLPAWLQNKGTNDV
jgi:hypothetical protein